MSPPLNILNIQIRDQAIRRLVGNLEIGTVMETIPTPDELALRDFVRDIRSLVLLGKFWAFPAAQTFGAAARRVRCPCTG